MSHGRVAGVVTSQLYASLMLCDISFLSIFIGTDAIYSEFRYDVLAIDQPGGCTAMRRALDVTGRP